MVEQLRKKYLEPSASGLVIGNTRLYTSEEVNDILWDFIQEAGNIYKASQKLGVVNAYLYQYARGDRSHSGLSPGLSKRLGFQEYSFYVGPADPALLACWDLLNSESKESK